MTLPTPKIKDLPQLNKWSQGISFIRNNLGINLPGSPLAIAFTLTALKAIDVLLAGTLKDPVIFPTDLVSNGNWKNAYGIWAGGMYNNSADYLFVVAPDSAPRAFLIKVYPYSKVKLPSNVTEFEFVQYSEVTCYSLPVVVV